LPRRPENKKNGKVGEKIRENISTDSALSIISGLFSIYGFEELKKELIKVESVRFLFSNPLCVRVVVASIEQKSLQFDRAIERLHDNRIFTGV